MSEWECPNGNVNVNVNDGPSDPLDARYHYSGLRFDGNQGNNQRSNTINPNAPNEPLPLLQDQIEFCRRHRHTEIPYEFPGMI
eukprot:1393623-Amorphochlora_amoeboformis.AAC.1